MTKENDSYTLFASVFLKSVQAALCESPTADDCFNLMRIFNPNLLPEDIRTEQKRAKLFKEICLRVHPDKHTGRLKEDATKSFQDLQNFMESCKSLDFSELSNEPPLKKVKKVDSELPTNFHVETNWPCTKQPLATDAEFFGKSSLDICYNMRGQIVHFSYTSRTIGKTYRPTLSQYKILTKARNNVEEIQKEIILRGPVLSRSYKSPKPENTEDDCPIIMGWKIDDVQGDVWLVRIPRLGNQDYTIAFGTCDIEDNIRIPKEDLTKIKWHPGAYFSVSPNTGKEEWMKWPGLLKNINTNTFMKVWAQQPMKKASDVTSKKIECELYVEPNSSDSKRAILYDFEVLSESLIKAHFTFL